MHDLSLLLSYDSFLYIQEYCFSHSISYLLFALMVTGILVGGIPLTFWHLAFAVISMKSLPRTMSRSLSSVFSPGSSGV